jgi:hypothetical protein
MRMKSRLCATFWVLCDRLAFLAIVGVVLCVCFLAVHPVNRILFYPLRSINVDLEDRCQAQ